MKFIFNFFYYIFVTFVLAIALLLLSTVMPLTGSYKVKVVQSGSMEPTIKTGGIVVIHPSETYGVGDIVTFGKDTKTQIPTTHRIVAVEGDGPLRTFATKGDANDDEDPTPIRLSDIHGKMVFTLPYVGYMLDFAKKPLGFGLLVGFPALLIILDELGKIFKEIGAMRRKKQLANAEKNQQNNSI